MERDVGLLHREIAAHIDRVRGEGAALAPAILDSVRSITSSLAPIVGQQGVAALQARSLQLTRSRFPWIAPEHQAVADSIDLDALQAALISQPPDQAALGGIALLCAFCDLLTSLVGASLTVRLLDGVWPPLRGGDLTQESAQ